MLEEIALPELGDRKKVSSLVNDFLMEAERRIDHFSKTHQPKIHNFVVCDFREVNAYLRWILDQQLTCGLTFCEWGSGFGVVAMLAALQRMEAFGIEVELKLVEQSEKLANDFDIPARFSHGSIIPHAANHLIESHEDIAHIDLHTASGYEELDMEVADFDLFFAFPWPGEESYWETLFDNFAADGSLLLTYRGMEHLKLHRKVR